MAIVISNLGVSTGTTEQAPDIRNIGDAISYQIASWNPPDDGIVVLCIISGENAGNIGITDVTGNGDVWELIEQKSYLDSGTPTRTIDFFAALGANLATGITTIDFDPNTQIFCYVSIFHITGADETGGASSGFVVGIPGEGTGTGTGTIDFPAPSSPGNRALIAVAHSANEAITVDAAYTKIDDMNGAGPAMGIVTAYDPNGMTDPAFTWTTSAAFGYLGLEIAEAPAALSPGYQRLFGPDHLLPAAATLFTSGFGQTVDIRSIDINNPTGQTVTANISIMFDQDSTRVIEVPIPAGESRNLRRYLGNHVVSEGEFVQGWASVASSLVCTIDGYVHEA